jgi:hypothetical protein
MQLLVASWLQHGSANSSAITHSLFPFIRLLQRTKLYDNEKSRAKAAFQATFSAATARRTAKVHAEGKIWRRQAIFLPLPRCSRRQNHALLALKITWGRETEAPYKPRTAHIRGDLAAKRPKQNSDRFHLARIALGECQKRSSSRYGIEPSLRPWWGTVPEHIPEVWYRRNGGKSPNQNARACQCWYTVRPR